MLDYAHDVKLASKFKLQQKKLLIETHLHNVVTEKLGVILLMLLIINLA